MPESRATELDPTPAHDGTHTESEDHAWTRRIDDHPGRSDSPEYIKSRTALHGLTNKAPGVAALYGVALPVAAGGMQDHHAGGLWLAEGDNPDAGQWFMVRNLAGLEWSAQFGSDPAKVDLLRQNAAKLYALFPKSAAALGIVELLATPITDAAGVALWVDSICNASVPLPAESHTGTLEDKHHGAGEHHYPLPVQSIPYTSLHPEAVFVVDGDGHPVAVTPTEAHDGSVEVQWAHPSSEHAAALHAAHHAGQRHIVSADHQLAQAHTQAKVL